MFQTINAQQQPYMQSGYGALGKLNTLLGIGGGGGRPMPVAGGGSMYRPSAGGGVRMQAALGPQQAPAAHNYGGGGYPDLKLRQILQLRAMQGDPQAISQLQQGGG